MKWKYKAEIVVRGADMCYQYKTPSRAEKATNEVSTKCNPGASISMSTEGVALNRAGSCGAGSYATNGYTEAQGLR